MKVLKKIIILSILLTILTPYMTIVKAISELEINNEIKNEISNEINNEEIINKLEDENIIENNVINDVTTDITNENFNNNVIIENEIQNEIINEVEQNTTLENVVNNLIDNNINNTIKNEIVQNVTNTINENIVDNNEIQIKDEEIIPEIYSGINDIKVVYSTHIQNIGWQEPVYNGQMSGTSGLSLRLEAIKINITGGEDLEGSIKYSTHVQNKGWQPFVETTVNSEEKDIAICGSLGEALRLEAIKIELTGKIAEQYDIYYRVHGQKFGWTGWAKNGEEAGSMGYALRLEGIEIKLIEKGGEAPGRTENRYYIVDPDIKYTTHVQNVGWQPFVKNGEMAGTRGKSLRLEAIKIKLDNSHYSGGIEYRTHVQNIGWLDFVNTKVNEKDENVLLSGTSGRSLRLEAIEIKLTGEVAEKFDIYYRVHAQNIGWLDWAKNGESAGTAGYGFRLEGIEIKLVKKGGSAPGATGIPFRRCYVGKIQIDSPIDLAEYTVPNKDEVTPNVLNLKGWAISTDETACIEVYLNGQKCYELVTRTERPDINSNNIKDWDAAIYNTKKPGFEAEIDISSLEENIHTITVMQRNRYGDSISRQDLKINVKKPRYLGKTVIDKPTNNYNIDIINNNSTTINVSGWSISEDSKAKLNVYLDNKLLLENVSRTERKDVNSTTLSQYKDWIEKTDLSGFSVNLTFDGNMLPGLHKIKVEQVSRYGHIISSEERVVNLINKNYVYNGRIFIDEPLNGRLLIKERNDSFKIKGWAISNDSEAIVQIFINGNLFDQRAVRQNRTDVNINTLPNNKEEVELTSQAGYLTTDLPVNVLGLAEGVHTITVKQIDRNGKIICEKTISIRVIDKTYKGIDVSRHNGTVDWNGVVENGFSFAILRIGYGKNSNQKDPNFETNYKRCKELGISVGVYLYSYAMNEEGALAEAENCLNWLNGRQLDLPVYFDLENTTLSYPQHTIPKETQTNMVINFCEKIESAGYKAGIYTNKNWMEDNLDMSRIENKYSVWLAHYTEGMDKVFIPTYNPLPTNYQGKYNMWQYTSNGNINGNRFDFNIFYY